MACDEDFFAALDEAEERLRQKEAPKKVRYWFEDGYEEGNEKDSEAGSTDSDSGAGPEEPAPAPAPEPCLAKAPTGSTSNAGSVENGANGADKEPSVDKDSYQFIVPRARGGRRLRWGGLSGAASIKDGDAGPTDKVESIDSLLKQFVPPDLAIAQQQAGGSSGSRSLPRELAEDVVEEQHRQRGAGFTRWSGGGASPAADTVDPLDVRSQYQRTGASANPQVRDPSSTATLQRLAADNAAAKRETMEATMARAARDAIRALCTESGPPKPRAIADSPIPTAARPTSGARPRPRESTSMLPGSLKGAPPAPPPQVVRGKEIKFVSAHSSSLFHTGPNDVQPDRDGAFRPPARTLPVDDAPKKRGEQTDRVVNPDLPTWFDYSPSGVQFG